MALIEMVIIVLDMIRTGITERDLIKRDSIITGMTNTVSIKMAIMQKAIIA